MSVQYSDPTVVDTRYKRARQEWDARMGDALVRAHHWRLTAVIALIGMVISNAGAIYLGTKPKSVPYVIEIDQVGDAVFRGELGKEAGAFKPSDIQVQAQLRQFVRDVRSVSSDRRVTERWWREAVAMCAGRCGRLLDEYVRNGGNPMQRMQRETVTVDIIATVPISAGVMQIDWHEKTWDVTGNLERDTLWRGIFQTQQRTPTSVDELRDNPLGLFVTEFHWDEVSR